MTYNDALTDELFNGDSSAVAVLDGPVPLTVLSPVPPFPVGALPKVIAEMVAAVSEAMQTDPAMAGTCAISVLSACAGGHAEIQIHSDWVEPLNTFTVITAEPGERKSAVQQAMTKILQKVEEDLCEAVLPKRREASMRKEIAQKRADKARIAATFERRDKDGNRDIAAELLAENEAVEAAEAAEAIGIPAIPRIIADDTTPEAATSLLAEQGGRIAILSAEGGIFDTMAGRYGDKVNIDVFLKGHAGDPIRVDRKSREPEFIPRPALTVGLMIQPAVLRIIGDNREFHGRGLLARVLYALPDSRLGHRKIAAAQVLVPVRNAYNDCITKLAKGLWETDSAVLTLTPKALEAIRTIEAAIEPQLSDDGELAALKAWGSKYAGAVARIAGLIHLAEHGADKQVDATTVQRANRIGEYFKACAVNAFTDNGMADAAYLLERLKGLDKVSERDAHRRCQGRFKTKDEMLPAWTQLIDYGYLDRVEEPEPGEKRRGQKPSPCYTVAQPRV
jgi:replicative DNA helicase